MNPVGETTKKAKKFSSDGDQGNMLLLRVGTQNLGKAEWLYLQPQLWTSLYLGIFKFKNKKNHIYNYISFNASDISTMLTKNMNTIGYLDLHNHIN